jgi:hypothetical protein
MKCRHFIAAAILLTMHVVVIANSSASYVLAQESPQYESVPVTLIPAITQNILTIVSLLIGTSSFILGLRIQNLARPATASTASPTSIIINKYMETLILALVIPSIFIIIFGIILVGVQLEIGDLAYLLLLFALFIPTGVILLLIRNLRRIPEK